MYIDSIMNNIEIIDDDRLENLIAEFAEKHDLLQMNYVNERFHNKDYYALQGKYCVSIDKYSQKTTEITFGIVNIIHDEFEEEMWYSLETECLFNIDVCYFFSEESLHQAFMNGCRKHNMIIHEE